MRQINGNLWLLTVAFALATCVALVVSEESKYKSNIFLNGEYHKLATASGQNAVKPLAALISKRATPFIGQMYLPTLLECKADKYCVEKEKCAKGYFSQPADKHLEVSVILLIPSNQRGKTQLKSFPSKSFSR